MPDDWRGLQQQVAQLLSECGFRVKVEEEVATARGKVEIDVFAEEDVQGRKYRIFCECKHWKARVPQNVIHSFRTVVSDSGANLGYIVSLAGFQSGAFSAAELTNLRLMTWQQFQKEFSRQWLEYSLPNVLRPRFHTFNALFTWSAPRFGFELPNIDRGALEALRFEYLAFWHLLGGWLEGHISLPSRQFVANLAMMDDSVVNWHGIPDSILDAVSYRDLFENAISYADSAVLEYLRILSKC